MPISFPEDTGHEDMAKGKVRNFIPPHCKSKQAPVLTEIVQSRLRECLVNYAWRPEARVGLWAGKHMEMTTIVAGRRGKWVLDLYYMDHTPRCRSRSPLQYRSQSSN